MLQRVHMRARLHTRSKDAKTLRRCGKVEWAKTKCDHRNGRERISVINRPSMTASGTPVERRNSSMIAIGAARLLQHCRDRR